MPIANFVHWIALSLFLLRMGIEPPFELKEGDRVVFVGSTFIERDQVYGYLETLLTARWPDRNISFRNLGWSGDTVWGEARARFGSPEDGFQHLKEHIEAIRPTVLFVAYGANESFDGEGGLARFEAGLARLLDMLKGAADEKARFILLSPLPQEDLGPPLPDASGHNEAVKRYGGAIQRMANERHYRFVDVYDAVAISAPAAIPHRYTDNGIHLTAAGYWKVAQAVDAQLGGARDTCEVRFRREGRPSGSPGTLITKIELQPNRVRFDVKHSMLPIPLPPAGAFAWDALTVQSHSALGLPVGRYRLNADGIEIGVFEKGDRPNMAQGPDYEQVEKLRQAITEKNQLYFHRWRPQNETYLFGFRKHEQGQNAAEVPKFDPLVQEKEELIAKLRVPVRHTYELFVEPD